MKCSNIQRRLSAYLDNEVPEPEKQVIAEHLKTCPQCLQTFQALQAVVNDLQLVENMEVPPYFYARLKPRIADQERNVPVLQKIRQIALPGFAVVLTLCALVLGNTMARTIYQGIAGPTSSIETANVFSIDAFDEYPEGSISNAYSGLIGGGE
jgi:predicted anti-sigma-YlaC factor YlaD